MWAKFDNYYRAIVWVVGYFWILKWRLARMRQMGWRIVPSSQKSLRSKLWSKEGFFGVKDLPLLQPCHSPWMVHEFSWLCCLLLSCSRWQCWFVLVSWSPGFPMQWSLCGQLLEGQAPFPYSSLWYPPSLPNLQPCTIRSSTRLLITDLPAARLVVWEQRRRSLWKTLGKIQKLETNFIFFVLKWGGSLGRHSGWSWVPEGLG